MFKSFVQEARDNRYSFTWAGLRWHRAFRLVMQMGTGKCAECFLARRREEADRESTTALNGGVFSRFWMVGAGHLR